MDLLEDGISRPSGPGLQFPKRGESIAALLLLVALVRIIRERSNAETTTQLAAAAQQFGIPKDEWHQFQCEL